ncbi:PREDICTED: calcium and integrin-binding protein 1-like [Priapulus caudatus]|uniref:Calcium and integrin-binding protein 1-like n=1 Tax=Priapulus caudatus TaxID=37621 RepID=A0ABM1ECJ0_PRICU|nr:PREDICTED: calcium and integrin-binding protein 1-like [Priapulus caudatus]
MKRMVNWLWSTMGASHSIFTESELTDYQNLTYLSKSEILHVHKRFCQMGKGFTKYTKVKKDVVLQLPEFKVNPFADRILQVFSSASDDALSFEDFLDMMSVFSDEAPRSVKVEYAFRIYDFDEDDTISEYDLEEVISRLTGSQSLSNEDMKQLIDNVFAEADLDEDRCLSFAEFEHVISKAPDFVNTFRIRV